MQASTNPIIPSTEHNMLGMGVSSKKEEFERVNLETLRALNLPDILVSEHPFRIEMNNVTPDDVALIENLDIPVIDKKIKHIIVELLQNIIKNQSKEHADHSRFTIQQKDGMLNLSMSNYLKNVINEKNKIEEITGRIEEVNPLSAEETKELYLKKLNDPAFTETGGGGLGFVDIARKIKAIDSSIEKVFTYNFIPTQEEGISEFELSIDIPIREKEKKQKMAS